MINIACWNKKHISFNIILLCYIMGLKNLLDIAANAYFTLVIILHLPRFEFPLYYLAFYSDL